MAVNHPSRRRFLEMVLPWPNGGHGFINLEICGEITKEDGTKFRGFWGRPTVDLQQFEQEVAKALAKPNRPDLYFCMSRQALTARSKRTGNVKTARHAKDALAVKAIWLDIDVGKIKDGKPDPGCYATLTEMQDALIDFLQKTAMPAPSAIVASGGGGYHVYWTSDRELTPEQWRPYAFGLKALVMQHTFKCDTNVIGDIARILRVPGTQHWKTGTPKPVTLEALTREYDFAAELAHLLLAAGERVVAKASDRDFELPANFGTLADCFIGETYDKLSAGIRRDAPPIDLELVKNECPWIKEALGNGGKSFDNTLWNYTTLCAAHAVDGTTMAHKMAAGHKVP